MTAKPAAALLVAGAWAVHAAPLVTANGPLRRRAFPGLSGQGRSDSVAVTFDDGPDPRSTPQVLDALDRLGWRCTFFLLGEMVRKDPGLARHVVERGHEVGVHGDRHRSHPLRTPHAVRQDVRRSVAMHEEVLGRAPRYFRPPYGSLSTASLVAARHAGLRTVLWTAAGRDWRADATGASVEANVVRDLRPGATVLLHDSDCTSAPDSWRSTIDALPRLAAVFAARGLTPVTLSEHLPT